ncbi:hypothetical protein GOEFS_095_00530 [Gordonia effusa NBRC 100432]|uniref:DUF389 domain-containing protein n=1 Tax=Gordonia effusa NBRC 100432 TaxID=1077974 RepID=H0R417_9ACTN|nr:DUF389 domain-containing protein [Gordonia effusa]GAB19818.1 hypothetical protein GOEFS_095_00530 [Gordonia effusa NBRC 100432]
MLNIRVTTDRETVTAAHELVANDPTVANIVSLTSSGPTDILFFDVARENANPIVAALRDLGIEQNGSITLSEPLTTISVAADRAEAHAPGHPDDALVWEHIEEQARGNARLSWSFVAFLVLATLIASIGRYTDQPILIVGAMVVGPEFAPIAAICVALIRRRGAPIPQAIATLALGFLVAGGLTWLLWALADLSGWVDYTAATTGESTQFIVSPDIWSFIIALLAGSAGVLSLTTSKSAALVGVFISVTTVPAIACIGLTLAVGAWHEAWSSSVQLAVNLAGLLIAGTATLAIQRFAWRRFGGLKSGE